MAFMGAAVAATFLVQSDITGSCCAASAAKAEPARGYSAN